MRDRRDVTATPAREMPAAPPVVVLTGPTALGKTAIAVELAARLRAQIVSADSMQVYAGLAILTNQPTAEQRRRVEHHLVGFVDPATEYSVAAYATAAHEVIDDLRAVGSPVIVEGGSGLHIRAALGDLGFGVPGDPTLRRQLDLRLQAEGLPALVAELEKRDPDTAERIDRANPRRVARALEVVCLQGAPLSGEQHGRLWQPPQRYPHIIVALDEDRALVHRRVDERVLEMMAAGALPEVRDLLAGCRPSRAVRQAIGVRELSAHLARECSLDEAIASMRARTRQLVRRQLTWMRKLPDAARIVVSRRSPAGVAEEVIALLDPLHR